MPMQTALAVPSGDLLKPPIRSDVVDFFRTITKVYLTDTYVGGGTQINQGFRLNGYPILFGPLGREFNCPEAKELAQRILEENKIRLEKEFLKHNIRAEVFIPMIRIGHQLCHVNGDQILLDGYHGFDRLYRLTLQSRVEQKEQEFSRYKEFNSRRIQIIGFPDIPPAP